MKQLFSAKGWKRAGAAAVAGIVLMAAGAKAVSAAGDEPWSFPVLVMDPPRKTGVEEFKGKEVNYTALKKSEVTKKWNICALFPHTTNDVIRAYIYGTIEEAKRLGAKMTIFDAGGYGHIDKQLAQFDDCEALGANAILTFAVSTTGLDEKIKQARAKGIKIIDLNVGVDTEADARVVVTYKTVGRKLGDILAHKHPKGSGKASVVLMPGPAGIPWAEDAVIGFKDAVKDSDVVVEKVVYGQSGRLDQQPLVEDVITTYPKLNYIVGMGTTIEAALNILREQGKLGSIGLYGTFITPDLLTALRAGQVNGVVVENSTVINRLAVDFAVRALENKLIYKDAIPAVTLVEKNTVDKSIETNFAPKDWQVQMKVD